MAEMVISRPRGAGALTERRAPETPSAPANPVAEIVDQITEKQSRAARQREARPAENPPCSSCPEEIVAGTPYQAVLSCSAEEPGTS